MEGLSEARANRFHLPKLSNTAAVPFENIVKCTTQVCSAALEMDLERPRERMRKFTKLNLISAFLFIQDLSRNLQFKFDRKFKETLAPHLFATHFLGGNARSTSGPKIAEYYETWRRDVDPAIGIRLDPKRAFDEEQKLQIYEIAAGKCALCGEDVMDGDDEYDHFPTAYRDGGKTTVDNARLVHKTCHPRGRPAISAED